MKITLENKKGLNKDLKVFIDKKTINNYLNEKYEEIKKNAVLKGFRPGKVPIEVLKRQFGKAVYGEVIDKVLKEATTKALDENKIKPAGQPKIDLKSFGEGKDLEYVISVTELPKVNIKPIEEIKIDQYKITIDKSEVNKRILDIAKNQKNFKDAPSEYKAKKGDLIIFDYKATIDGKDFKGNEGKNTQIELGKDLFIKGFDENLVGVKKNETKEINTVLPENYPQKELSNKKAKFNCKIINLKKPEEIQINDDFAKNLGAKDLKNLEELVSKQINDEYTNSLDNLTKNQILIQLEKIKVDQIPENLIEQEIKILSQNMNEEDATKNKIKFKEDAKKRVKLGLILNQFGEQNNIKVEDHEIKEEIQKQLKMMPGQEKIVMEYYQKNPSAAASLRGTIYEDKIINQIKVKAKINIKNINKDDAEKLLKSSNENMHTHSFKDQNDNNKVKKTTSSMKVKNQKKPKIIKKKKTKVKKVSKK